MKIEPFGPDIWVANGPNVAVIGPVMLPTRMVVVRLQDGSLWINSPIEATRMEMAEVERLGPVRDLVSPAKLHRWRLAAWNAAYPNARTWAPPEIFADTPPAQWANDLDQVVFGGNAFVREVEFFHLKSRTLIFNDFIQNYAPQPRRPLLDFFLKISGTRGGGVPNDIKWTMTRKELARRSLRKLLSWDFDNLIVAHGNDVIGGARALVESAFDFL